MTKDFKTEFENKYLNQPESGKATLKKIQNDFQVNFEKKYGYDQLLKREQDSLSIIRTKREAERAQDTRLQQESELEFAQTIARGKRNQNIFSDNALIQSQLRQETGPILYDLMDDKEKERYFYEIGKNGTAAGKAYLEEITPKLQKIGYETTTKKAYEESKDNILAGIAYNMIASMGMGAGYVEDAIRALRGKEANPYSTGHTLSEIENVSRQALKETAQGDGEENFWRDFAIDTGLSMGQTVARLPFGTYGLTIAGLGAATKGEEDALKRGATKAQAFGSGAAQGAAEVLAEKLSLGSLEAMKEVPVNTWKDVAKNVGKQMFSEGSEEMLTEAANTLTDRLIMGEKSDWTTTKNQYMDEGDGELEALLKTAGGTVKDIGLAGLGGAISGGIMGGSVSGLNAMQQERIGKISNISNYRELADGIHTDRGWYKREETYKKAMQVKKEAEEFAQRQENGEEFTDLERGRFAQDYFEYWGAVEQEQNDAVEPRSRFAFDFTEYWKAIEKEQEGDLEPNETDLKDFRSTMNRSKEIAPVQGNLSTDESKAPTETRKNVINTHENVNKTVENVSNREDIAEFGAELGEYGKKALVENYDGSATMEDYRTAYNRYYDAGRHNVELQTADRAAISSILSDKQAMAAYKAGAQDRNKAAGLLNEAGRYIKGKAKTGTAIDVSGRATDAQMKVANIVGKKTGLKVELIDGSGNVGGNYSRKAGTIRISVDSENYLQTTSHELTHFIKDYAPTEFEAYKDVCVRALMDSNQISYDEVVKRYEDKYMETGTVKTRDEIMEEIVADATGQFLNDEDFINQISKENRTVAQKIMDFISDMIDSIKQLMRSDNTTKVSKALKNQLDYYENARDMWAYGLESAGERYRSGEELTDANSERFMLKNPDEVTEDKIEANFDYVRNMDPVVTLKGDEFTRRDIKISDQIMDYYDSFGNVVHNDVVGDILLKKRAVKDDVAHGIGRLKSITFQAVPDVLEKGKVLQYEKQWKGRGYDTVTIGARVDIAEGTCAGEYYVACIVKVDETNRMYLHEVHTTKMDDTTPFWTGGDQKAVLPGGDNHPSISSIFKKLTNVNESREKTVNSAEGVRIQLQGIDDATDMDSLMAENAELKKANEYLTQQLNSTKDYAPGLEDIEAIADKIKKNYGSNYPKARMVENLQKLYNYIRNSEQVDGEEVTRAATAIGRSVIEKAEMKDTAMKEQYQDLLDHLKNTKIVLPERFRNELDTVGGYSNFRKRYFGKLRIGNSGVDVDTAYEELTSLYPSLFDESIVNPADQIVKIAEVVDMIRPTVKNPYHANMDEAAFLVGQELLEEYFNVRSLEPTRRDKMDAQVYEIRRKYEEQLNAYKTRLKAEYEGDLKEAEKEFVRQRQELSHKYNTLPKEDSAGRAEIRRQLRELEANKDINKDVIAGKLKYQRRRDASEARKHKERIIKDVSEMAVWLEKPTDKKHVPEALRVPLADFLKGVDFSSDRPNANGDPTSRTIAWMKLESLFGKIANDGSLSDEDGDIYMEVDPDIAAKMNVLEEKVKDFDKMENLALKDLRILREVVQSMKRCVIDANLMYENKSYERIEDVADAFQKDNKNRKNKVEYAGYIGTAMRMMQSDMLDANTMFSRMGPAATSVYQELRDGFDKKIQNTKIAQDYMDDLLKANNITEKDIREWSGKNAKVYEFEIDNKKIKFTTAQIMSLYAQNKREQARGHIYSEVGGIKTAPTVRYDKTQKAYVIDKTSAPVKVNPLDVENITKVLTPEQKNLADGIVKFFTTQTSEWGNEVTMRMYGYKKFMAPNYFPIVVDDSYVATKNSTLENSITTLKNMGATKSTVYKANNPIIIEDIFDVFTRQADQMGSYNAFVIPLSDMQKFLNHKVKGEGSVKETIDRIFGPGGQDYIKQLMVDVNGTSTGTKDITSAMIRNMKSASVGANLRTAIQQPTAYVRAMAEINPKYLMEGLTKSEDDWDMAKKYSPIVQWKEWGYFDVNTGRSMKNILMGSESLRETMTEKSMWLTGKADEIAWKRLWEAAKAETRDLHPELKEGSEEFYTQAGKRLTDIIDQTQVVDSVLHRSKLMKSNNGLVQMYTSFMSEPTKTYNMLYRAIADYGTNKTPESKKRMGRIAVTWALSNAVTAAAAAVIDAMRDEDEEKTLPEKYTTALTENLIDNMNPANMVPILRDVISIFNGYQVQRTDMQAVQQVYYAWNKIVKYANGESALTIPGLMYDCSKALSLMTGVPVNNALRDLNGAVNTILGEAGAVDAIYSKERLLKDIGSTDNLKRYVGLAMKAYYNGDKATGDRIIEDLKTAGIDESKIKSKYKTVLKDNSLVIAAAEARLAGNYGEYDSLVDDLEAQGFVREYVEDAVTTAGNKINPDANLQSGYGYADATRAFRTSKTEFDRVVDALIEQKKAEKEAEGKEFDEADVISQIKARFTKEYKEEYINGNDAKRKEIRTLLYSVKVKGKQLFSDKDFKNWMK